MMHKIVVAWIALMLVNVLAPQAVSPAYAAAPPFPMTKGTYWVYTGPTKWTTADTGEVQEQVLTWKMEITDALQRDGIGLAVVKGHPSDLAFYEEGRAPGDYLIVSVNDQKYYLLSGERAQAALKRFKDSNDVLVGLVEDSGLWLDLPLTVGKSFGDTTQIARPDRMYAWQVGKQGPAQLTGVTGVTPSANAVAFELTLTTLPENDMVEFVPGLGITRFVYEHHGTVASTDLKLTEFHPG
jgi:hypothetical protein